MDEEESRALLARCSYLAAENERHRRVNLVRAVVDGHEEWIAEAINAEDWDAIPWRVAERMTERLTETRQALRDLADQFQDLYERVYAPAPAGENGVYHHARSLASRGTSHDNGGEK